MIHTQPSSFVHDLRTPLNQIIGYSEMLVEQAREGGQLNFVPDLEKVLAAGARMLAIIEAAPSVEASPSAKDGIPPAEKPSANGQHQPPIEGAPTVSEISQSVPGGGGSQLGALILVVDDDEGNRDVLSRRLQKEGYTVDQAVEGGSALDKLAAGNFDMVLLDIMMPEMDGYEVLRQMKGDERLRHIPVIMISALSEMDSVARCIEMGADDYLPKPFNPVLLKARVGASLEKKRSRDREMALLAKVQQDYERLKELEQLRDDLTNMIIHDLRTPLTSVVAAMHTFGVVGEVSGAQQEVMTIAISGADSLLAQINSLLDIEKLESGVMELDISLLSLPELVESAVAQVAPAAQAKGIELVQSIGPDLPWLNADEDKLRRALVNLLGNAVKFTPAGGKVTVEVSRGGLGVCFRVCDTGEGIPSEDFGLIFEKFGQGSRKIGHEMSTGLGLTFCKLAVEAHGGEIAVTSASDQGSTFSFSIPLAGVV